MRENSHKLKRVEICIYVGTWTCACFYAIYHVYLATDKYFKNYDDAYNDFSSGWNFLNRKMDSSDEEWKFWIPLVYRLIPWITTQVFISQYLKKYFCNKDVLCSWYILMSIAFLLYYYGLISTLLTLLLPCISCLLTSYKSKLVSWIVHALSLVIIYQANKSEATFRQWLNLNDVDYYMLVSAISWTQLRSLSYSLDSIDAYWDHKSNSGGDNLPAASIAPKIKHGGCKVRLAAELDSALSVLYPHHYSILDPNKNKNTFGLFNDLIQNIAFCLYLPTLFLGPVILYKQFVDSIQKPYFQWSKDRILKLILNLARYTFWMFFTDFSMHYVYFNALRFHPRAVKNLEPWAFYGVGYCMGQYFLNKYVVIYGFTSTIAKAEDIDAPPQPKCISRIYLYSDMWKHFDRGLYKFLLKYIYIPVYNPKTPFRKFFASALTFIFIYLWHGMHYFVFIWAFLNFVGIVIESIVRSNNTYFYKKILYVLSPQNQQRLECALASPLLILSALSSFYFFAGEEIGNIYVKRVFEENWKTVAILLFILYCCCQTSKEVKQMEEIRMVCSKDTKMKMKNF